MTVEELQALIDTCTTGLVEITETVDVIGLDYLDLKGCEVRSTADPMFRITASHWAIQNGKIRSTAGVTFDLVSSTLGLISGVWAQNFVPDKEIIRCVGNSSCYDTLFQASQFEKGANMTAPIVRVSVDGPFFNSNAWSSIRFQTNGNAGAPQSPCVLLECLATDNWLYANSFTNINGEICNAGLIHCGSCYGTIMQNIAVYDTHIGGNITDDIIKLIKSTTPGLDCRRTMITNYSRLSGVLDEGKYDINVVNHNTDGVLLQQISGTGSRLRVRCPIETTRIEVQDFLTSWTNS